MLDIAKRSAAPGITLGASPLLRRELVARWRHGLSIVNLRGSVDDVEFLAGASKALSLALPTRPCSMTVNSAMRLVWAGPDDWFAIGPAGQADGIVVGLGTELAATTHSVTDVSSGYTVLNLGGAPVREVLAQGCPLDLHPRAFKLGMSAGSHFFKTSVWLWQTEDTQNFEVLVRRSFMGYFWTMLERCSAECGLLTVHCA